MSDAAQPQNDNLVAKTKKYLEEKEDQANVGASTSTQALPQSATTQEPSDQSPTSSRDLPVRGMTSLADAMATKGFIDEQALKSIKFESITSNKSHEQLLLEHNYATEDDIQRTKAEMYGLGFIDLGAIGIDPQVLNKISQEVADRNMAIVFEETSNRYKVAMYDPLDLQKISYLQSLLGKRVDAYYATSTAIKNIVDRKYGAQIGEAVDKALEDVGLVDISGPKMADLSSVRGDGAARIVNMILDYAIKHQASDVHIEPRDNRIVVRFRIHGLLSQQLSNIPPSLGPSIVSRIKILANMKIDEHRIPQDNRFQVKSDDKVVDIRVSVMPNIYGEKVVLRLLEKGASSIGLEKTGLRGPAYKLYRNALNKTQGIILITGPTGSGKTVTLASSLAILNKQEVNIVTIEDPVEIRIDGITQVQVNPQVGLTFATGLRSFLRQDPDIIMVGEIRDAETAELAIQAALTGHLVLATLHTNSAAGALPRLLDMGMQPFLLASTIDVIAAQRLVRRLCDQCKKQIDATPEQMKILHDNLDSIGGFTINTSSEEQVHFDSSIETVKLYEHVGCPQCNDTGYSGRLGIFEVFEMTEKIGKLVMAHDSEASIQKEATQDGMVTMAQDGLMKVLEGSTTIEEVLRVQTV